MLSRLHTVTDITPALMLKSVEGLELNSRNALERFGDIPFVHIKEEGSQITAGFSVDLAPYCKKLFNRHCYDVIILFYNNKGKATGSAAIRSRRVKHTEPAGE